MEERYRSFMAYLAICLTAGLPVSVAAESDDPFGALRGLERAEATGPEIRESFEPWSGETIVLLGGTSVVDQQFANYFETLATLAWRDKQLRFRNLAWEADTVYRQQRPLYFFDRFNYDQRPGSTPDQRKRVPAGTALARFGKMESLDGLEEIPAFSAAYGDFLDKLIEFTARVVVIIPTPFFASGPAGHLSGRRNETLEAYGQAIRKLAKERGLLVVDLLRMIPADAALSKNGVHLNDRGQRLVARTLVDELGRVDSSVYQNTKEFEELRERTRYKNSIWLQYYRPTNWSFLYGDRQHVPSSRDYLNGEKRWFPFEVESALSLIKREEHNIREIAMKAELNEG